MKAERRDFLLEIGTEELPPRSLHALQQALVTALSAGLARADLAHGELVGFATPRRLAVWVKRLAAQQPEQHLKRRGPPLSAALDAAGRPTRAALGFAESCGTSLEALQRLDEGKGTFLFFLGTKAGERAVVLLPGLVQAALDALPIARRMHWGAGNALFVRPVHWVVMLYGREVVPATLLDTPAGHLTRGHRFHAPRPIRIASPGSYERTLRERGHVLADFAVRRERIRAQVTTAAAEAQGRALISEALLQEVTALVEWPVALTGRFEERFLPLPRLADAAFFWEQDRRQPLAARCAGLDAVTFQAKLGSLGEKTRRVGALAAEIALAAGGSREHAVRAAQLCKCDLLTAMVGEFPELQGIMGTYYAQADGEPHEVAAAIREHYLPRAAGDQLPGTRAGLALAIADKLDTLAGIFAIGEKPTGTKDPFGLRRAALGVQRMLIEKELDLDLRRYIDQALAAVRADIARLRATAATATPAGAAAPERTPAGAAATSTDSTAGEIYDFLMERLRAYYLDNAGAPPLPGQAVVTAEMFDAVLAARPASPLDFDARLKALSTFLELPESASLTAANKRIANILRKANETPPPEVDVLRLRESAEVRLFDSMRALRDAVATATARREYAGALGQLAQLRPAVDAFFDQVLVMDENPQLRANRLSLLAQLQGLFAGIADLSRLPG